MRNTSSHTAFCFALVLAVIVSQPTLALSGPAYTVSFNMLRGKQMLGHYFFVCGYSIIYNVRTCHSFRLLTSLFLRGSRWYGALECGAFVPISRDSVVWASSVNVLQGPSVITGNVGSYPGVMTPGEVRLITA